MGFEQADSQNGGLNSSYVTQSQNPHDARRREENLEHKIVRMWSLYRKVFCSAVTENLEHKIVWMWSLYRKVFCSGVTENSATLPTLRLVG
jgi:hypothetical protein